MTAPHVRYDRSERFLSIQDGGAHDRKCDDVTIQDGGAQVGIQYGGQVEWGHEERS